MNREPVWLDWAKKLNSIAQVGLTYSKNSYDLERYKQIQNISIDILNRYTDLDRQIIHNLFANEVGYPTPKIDVRAAIFKYDKILMIREKIDGLWAIPGGWADVDTSLKENLLKEAKEEAGVDINPKRIIAVLDRRKHNEPPLPYGVYKIFVECDYISGSFKNNVETYESGFFTLDTLPPLSLGRNTKKQIEMCFAVRQKQVHETIFD
jgi:ADP-ribose pyrophosphatase YjhB (NUDIX family)